MTRVDRNRAWRERRKAAGICIDCPTVLDAISKAHGNVRCSDCRRYYAECQKDRRVYGTDDGRAV